MIPMQKNNIQLHPTPRKGLISKQNSQSAQKRRYITKRKSKRSKQTESQLKQKNVPNFKEVNHIEKTNTFEMKDDENLHTLEIFGDNYLLSIEFGEQQIIFDLTAQNACKKLRYFSKKIYYQESKSTSPLSFQISKEQLREMLKNEKNYELRIKQRVLILKWELVSENFRKQVLQKIVFDQIPIQQVNNLKLQIFLLKKKINQMGKKKPLDTVELVLKQTNRNIKKLRAQNIKIEEVDEKNIIILDDQEKDLRGVKIHDIQQTINRGALKKKRIKKAKAKSQYLIATGNKIGQNQNIQVKKYRKRRGKKSSNIEKITQEDFQKIKKRTEQSYQKQNKDQKLMEQMKENSIFEVHQQDQSYNCNFYCDYQIKIAGEKIKFTFDNGDYYFGQVDGNKYHGKGTYYSKSNEQIFQGTWIQGVVYGQGRRIDKDHNISYGFFIKGKRTGKGLDQYENGEKYQGEFLDDYRSGFGTYYYKDKSYYRGEWVNDQCHGHGCQYYSDGSYYEGEWFQDQKHGEGKFYKDNKIYRQDYMNGVLISEFLFKEMNYNKIQENKSIKDY